MVSTSQKSTFLTCRLFQKTPGRLVPDGWVGPKSSGCRCHFRAFQLKLFILDIQNFGNGPVVKKLQLFENAKFSKNPKNHRFSLGDSPSTLGPTVALFHAPSFYLMLGSDRECSQFCWKSLHNEIAGTPPQADTFWFSSSEICYFFKNLCIPKVKIPKMRLAAGQPHHLICSKSILVEGK